MKRVASAIAMLIFTLMFAAYAFGQVTAVPNSLNFQGRLAKPDGTPVPNGNYSLRFSLWSAASAGTERWNQTINPVGVKNGTFAVMLSGFPAGTFNGDNWLEIKIGANAPLTPRQQLVSVAYAMKASTVPDSSITSAKIADGTITSTDIANATISADKLVANALNSLSWLLGGNSGTNPISQFLGTMDNKDLVFRTNNVERMRLLTTGKLDVAGDLNVGTANVDMGLSNEVGGTNPILNLDVNFRQTNRNNVHPGAAVRLDMRPDFPTFQVLSRSAGTDVERYLLRINDASVTLNNLLYEGSNVIGGWNDNNVFFNVTSATLFGGGTYNGTNQSNLVSDIGGTVSGGTDNHAGNENSDTTDARYATIGGGNHNRATGEYAAVGGGANNNVTSGFSVIAGGQGNTASGFASTVAGGDFNTASGTRSTVLGGNSNTAAGDFSAAAGFRAKANHAGTFVWADSQNADFASTNSDQFLIRAKNGVSINTTPSVSYGLWVTGGLSTGIYGVGPLVGVQGESTNGYGLQGTSYYGFGVYGSSVDGFGIRGLSTNNNGVYGTSANNAGVEGYSSDNIGVRGSSNNSYGVIGLSSFNIGVYGESSNNQNASIYGRGGINNVAVFGGNLPSFGRSAFESNLSSGSGTSHIYCANNYLPVFYVTGSGQVFANAGYTTSDARYKTHIASLENSLGAILNLRGVTFDWDRETWKAREFPEGRQIGFIAQEVEKIAPELVSTDDKGYKSVNYVGIVPILVEAVKSLSAKVNEQKKQIADLKTAAQENTALKALLSDVLKRLDKVEAETRH